MGRVFRTRTPVLADEKRSPVDNGVGVGAKLRRNPGPRLNASLGNDAIKVGTARAGASAPIWLHCARVGPSADRHAGGLPVNPDESERLWALVRSAAARAGSAGRCRSAARVDRADGVALGRHLSVAASGAGPGTGAAADQGAAGGASGANRLATAQPLSARCRDHRGWGRRRRARARRPRRAGRRLRPGRRLTDPATGARGNPVSPLTLPEARVIRSRCFHQMRSATAPTVMLS